jgi:hypothetical protein
MSFGSMERQKEKSRDSLYIPVDDLERKKQEDI